MGSIIFIKKKEIDFIGRRNEMATIRERVNSTSDSYYVSGEGYKNARRRMETNRFNFKMNAVVFAIGVTLFLFGIGGLKSRMEIARKMVWVGIGFLVIAGLTTWLTYRSRRNE